MSVEDVDLGFDDFFSKIDELVSVEADVGYTQASGKSGDISLVDLASIHELGTKDIPARPFMRLSFDNNAKEIGDVGVKLASSFLEDKIDVVQLHEIWGDFYRQEMINGVTTRELGLTENKPATIRRKGSDTPLIDTAEMINRSSVTVKEK